MRAVHRSRAKAIVALATTVALAAARPAFAACPEDAAHHVAQIRAELHAQAAYSRTWSIAWTAGLAGMALAQAGLTFWPKLDAGTRADLWVGAAASLIGAAYMLLMPPEVVGDADRFDRIATTAGADKCEVLARGEGILLSAAADEASGRGWVVQVFNGVLNTAVLLVLGLGFGRWWPSGVVGAVGGEATAEATIFTQPMGLPGFVANARAEGWLPPAPTRVGRAPATPGAAPALSFTLHF